MTTAYAWMRRIRDREDIPASTKAVAVMLGLRANRENECHPTYNRIAQDTGLHRRTVIREIKRLESLGLILVIPNKTPRGDTANIYVLIHNTSPAEEGGVTHDHPPSDTRPPLRGWQSATQKYIPNEVQRNGAKTPVDSALTALVKDLTRNRKP